MQTSFASKNVMKSTVVYQKTDVNVFITIICKNRIKVEKECPSFELHTSLSFLINGFVISKAKILTMRKFWAQNLPKAFFPPSFISPKNTTF